MTLGLKLSIIALVMAACALWLSAGEHSPVTLIFSIVSIGLSVTSLALLATTHGMRK